MYIRPEIHLPILRHLKRFLMVLQPLRRPNTLLPFRFRRHPRHPLHRTIHHGREISPHLRHTIRAENILPHPLIPRLSHNTRQLHNIIIPTTLPPGDIDEVVAEFP